MAFSSKRRVVLAVIATVFLAACSKKPALPPSLILNGFERVPDPALAKRQFDPAEALKKPTYPDHDFDLSTSGYAKLSPIDKAQARAAKDKPLYQFIKGKSAGQVRFTVPGDYKKKGEGFPKTWESGLTLSIDSHTALKDTDWSAYKYLDVPVFNPGTTPQTVMVRYNDSASGSTTTSAIAPVGESVLEFPLQTLSDARLNEADIKSLTIYLDTAGQEKDPVLIFDEIGLHGMTAEERAKLALEEGDQSDDEEDWDSEDEDAATAKKLVVMRPGMEAPAPAAVSGTSKAD